MADETPPPPGAPGQPDRRRPAPTIDLAATEIANDAMAGTPAAAAGPEPTSSSGPPPDGATPPPDTTAPRPGWAAFVTWPLVGAGLAGAILALGIVGVVVLSTGGNDSSAIESRTAHLEQQVADLAARAPTAPAPADTGNPASAGDLAGRVQKLEAQQAQSAAVPVADPALANRIAAVESQFKSLGETVSALQQRSDSTAAANAAALNDLAQKLARAETTAAPSGEASGEAGANTAAIAALTSRLDALEGDAKTTEAKLAAAAADHDALTSDDHAVRMAVIAAALSAAVERGRPFVAELKAAQAQAADAQALVPLEGFAATGVPNVNGLVRELTSLEPALLQAARVPVEGGFLDKLQANAERLVRIRPIEEIPGDDPATVIARVEIKAMRGDVPGALAELGNLPPPVRAPAQGWVAKAQARAAAVAASRAFAADALVALAQPSR